MSKYTETGFAPDYHKLPEGFSKGLGIRRFRKGNLVIAYKKGREFWYADLKKSHEHRISKKRAKKLWSKQK